MTRLDPTSLRSVLSLDALIGALCGLLMTAGSTWLASLTALPERLLLLAGASLFPVAALMLFAARRAPTSAPLVGLVVVGNGAWTLASLWLVVARVVPMNGLGAAFVLGQALVVAVFTVLEARGARRLFTLQGEHAASAR